MTMLETFIKPMHREGIKFVLIFAVITAGLFLISDWLGWGGFGLTIWCYYFFRDPKRTTPEREGLLVSPADGIISLIEKAVPPEELGMASDPLTAPIAGEVASIAYRPGKYLNASLDKASVDNERNSLTIEIADGRQIAVVQIAGLVARRIVCFVKQAQALRTGERFGLIRFGSRVDVYLPDGVQPMVSVGQSMIAGETVIADLTADEPARSARTE